MKGCSLVEVCNGPAGEQGEEGEGEERQEGMERLPPLTEVEFINHDKLIQKNLVSLHY
jgi:hypothetical protein